MTRAIPIVVALAAAVTISFGASAQAPHPTSSARGSTSGADVVLPAEAIQPTPTPNATPTPAPPAPVGISAPHPVARPTATPAPVAKPAAKTTCRWYNPPAIRCAVTMTTSQMWVCPPTSCTNAVHEDTYPAGTVFSINTTPRPGARNPDGSMTAGDGSHWFQVTASGWVAATTLRFV